MINENSDIFFAGPYIIVLDNLSAHHSTLTEQQLSENVEVVFLPPYSPEFSQVS